MCAGMGISISCEVDGVNYGSLAAACRAYGISKGTVEKRMRGGVPLEHALKKPVRNAVVTIFGYDWGSAKVACEAFALPYSTYRARTGKHSMTPEEAILQPTVRGYRGYSLETAISICQTRAIGESHGSEDTKNNVNTDDG